MKQISIIFLFGLFPIIAVSSNLAYALVMLLSLWTFLGSYVLATFFSALLKIEHGRIFAFFFTFVLYFIYVKLGELLFPLIFFSLLPHIYLLGFSYILYFSLAEYEQTGLPMMLVRYSILLFLLSFMREIFAFGSVSIPYIYGVLSLNIFEFLGLSAPFKFLGSSAGTLMLLSFTTAFYFWYSNDDPIYLKREINELFEHSCIF